MRDGRVMFLANQTDVTHQSKANISQSDDKSDDSSISTSGSKILTRLDVQKKDLRFAWTLKRWKTVSDISNVLVASFRIFHNRSIFENSP